MPEGKGPIACVMGDMDLVRALGLSGIRCAVVAPAGSPPRYSRFSRAVLDWFDAWDQPDQLIETLVRFGSAQKERPVLFYDEDGYLLLISRHRSRLAGFFRFVIPEPALVEDLVDKARFQALAKRLDLPVPAARVLQPSHGPLAREIDLTFPIIIKPLTRRPTRWAPIGGSGKALQVNTWSKLRDLWSRLAVADVPILAQELIPGAEAAIESYHVYVDERGSIAGEFTGKKIRTYPSRFGDSTALITTKAADVAALGRGIARRLNFRGVAKFDFKRSPDGTLHLLEINPRFSLWHHLGAMADVNIPALVYHDLADLPRPSDSEVREGVRWCRLWQDVWAAKEAGIPLFKWLPWALACDAKSAIAFDDPLALLGAAASRGFSRLAHRARPSEH